MPHWHLRGSRRGDGRLDRALSRVVLALERDGMTVLQRTDDRILFRAEGGAGPLAGVDEGEILLLASPTPEASSEACARLDLAYRLSLDRLAASLYLSLAAILLFGLAYSLFFLGRLRVEAALWGLLFVVPLVGYFLWRRARIRRELERVLDEGFTA